MEVLMQFTDTDFGETMNQGYVQAKYEICYAGGIYELCTGLYYLKWPDIIIQKMEDPNRRYLSWRK